MPTELSLDRDTLFLCAHCRRPLPDESGHCTDCPGGEEPIYLPSRIGPYRVLSFAGAGPLGSVYQCHDDITNRTVAIKVLTCPNAPVDRVSRDARAVGRVRHAAVATIYSVGRNNGRPFVVSELIDGRSVQDMLDERQRLDPREALLIVREAALGLSAAASLGVLHRNLKPSNLVVARDGQVKVLDFGLGAPIPGCDGLNDAQPIFGSPAFLSPEQARLKPLDLRSDIYGLGATLFHMLSGRPPFTDEKPLDLVVKHLVAPPPDILEVAPDLHAAMSPLIGRMLSKAPEHRQQGYDELINDVDEVLASLLLASRVRIEVESGEFEFDIGSSCPIPASA